MANQSYSLEMRFTDKARKWRWVGIVVCSIFLSLSIASADTAVGTKPYTGGLSREQAKKADAAAWFATGLALQLEGKSVQAMDAFAKSARMDPANLALVEQVIPYLLSTRKSEDAIEILKQSIQSYPEREQLYSLLSMSYLAARKLDDALKLNAELLKRNPKSINAIRSSMAIYFQTGQKDELKDLVESSLAIKDREPADWLMLAEVFHQFRMAGQGDKEQLLGWTKNALQQISLESNISTGVKARLAQIYEEIQERKLAIQLYEEILESNDIPSIIRTRLAFLYLQTGQIQKAGNLAKVLIELEPLNPFGYRIAGYLEQDKRDFGKAAEYFESAVKYAPKFEPAYFDLFTSYLNSQKDDKARDILGKIRTNFKPSFQLLYYEGLIESREENYEKAFQSYEAAFDLGQKSAPERLTPFFYFQLGIACERVKEFEKCETYFRKAIELDPKFAEALNYLGYTWADQGVRLEEALELIEKAVELDPQNSAFLDSLGWVHFKLGQYKKALRFQLKAVEFSETPDPVMFDHLGDMYLKLEMKSKGIEAYKKALEIDEKNEVTTSIQDKLKELE